MKKKGTSSAAERYRWGVLVRGDIVRRLLIEDGVLGTGPDFFERWCVRRLSRSSPSPSPSREWTRSTSCECCASAAATSRRRNERSATTPCSSSCCGRGTTRGWSH